MNESERLDLIREIEEKRGSRVIVYITNSRRGRGMPIETEDARIIEKHLREMGPSRIKKLDLFIYTSGGEAVASWNLVSLLREYLGARQFSVLVPSRAMSAGTKICLGADEVVMAPGGYLGPVDTQLGGILSVEDVQGYFDLMQREGLKTPADKLQLFSILAEKFDPMLLGVIERVRQEGARATMLLLNNRRKPLPEKVNQQIADYLLRRIGNHSQSIRRTEARGAGMSFVRDAEEFGIDGTMASLFDAYENLLLIDVPYTGQDDLWNGEAQNDGFFDPGPVALIESIDRLDVARLSRGTRFWRDAPANAKKSAAPAGGDDDDDYYAAAGRPVFAAPAPGEPATVPGEPARAGQPVIEWQTLRAPVAPEKGKRAAPMKTPQRQPFFK